MLHAWESPVKSRSRRDISAKSPDFRDVRRSSHSLPVGSRNTACQRRPDVLGAAGQSQTQQGTAHPGNWIRHAGCRLRGSAVSPRLAWCQRRGDQQSGHPGWLPAGAQWRCRAERTALCAHRRLCAGGHGADLGDRRRALAGRHVDARKLGADCARQRTDGLGAVALPGAQATALTVHRGCGCRGAYRRVCRTCACPAVVRDRVRRPGPGAGWQAHHL